MFTLFNIINYIGIGLLILSFYGTLFQLIRIFKDKENHVDFKTEIIMSLVATALLVFNS